MHRGPLRNEPLKVKQAVILAIIVLAPLAMIAWLGVRIWTAEREVVRHQFTELLTARLLLIDQELTHAPASADAGSGGSIEKGWYPWYWENGLSLIFWRRMSDGHTVAIELERARLMSDIVARLPSAEPGGGIDGSMT